MVGAPLGSTETLMQAWISQGLGFCLSQIEQAFDKLFGLDGEPDEYTEFDTSALLRSAHKDRIDALARGIQGGVYSVNEARNMEGLDSVPFGQDVRLQAQNVPLSAAASIAAVPAAPAAPAAPAIGNDDVVASSYETQKRRDLDAMRTVITKSGRSR